MNGIIRSDKPVLVIGSASLDIIGRLENNLQTGTSNPARIRASQGGVARNVAENLARLGHAATLITAVGDDSTGQAILSKTAEAGVEVRACIQNPDFPTGFYLGVLDQIGNLAFALDDMRVLSRITPEYIQQQSDLFNQSSLVFVDANLPEKVLRTVFSLARKAHLPVCADPTSTALAPRLKPFLARLHLTTPNAAEAGILSGLAFDSSNRQAAIESARHLVNQGVKIAVITLAEFGVCYATSETNGHIPAIRTNIVDPTGAGDALTAAVIFSLLNDIPLDDAVRLGVSAASLTLRCQGTVNPNLSLEELYSQLLV